MSQFRFTWDPAKALENERKHDIGFDEARTVFADEGALLIDDPDHSVHSGAHEMRDEYDFANASKNPYAKKIKKQVTIRLEPEVIDYFKELAQDNGIPYQTLINLYLRDCAQSGKKPSIEWAA